MKNILIGIFSALVLPTIYFLWQFSADHRVNSELIDGLKQEGLVQLDGCNLSISREVEGEIDAPISLTRIITKVDLRNYDLKEFGIRPTTHAIILRVNRLPLRERTLEQVAKINDLSGLRAEQSPLDSESIRKILEAENGSLFYRVMAEVVSTDSGEQQLVAHEDAPDFYEFATASRNFLHQSASALPRRLHREAHLLIRF
ncbi:MAG: hypothetical protein VXZ18_03945 [Pseudomonadota bacterium]|nr:hypothetical protein [Pseudomonadota bacterium]